MYSPVTLLYSLRPRKRAGGAYSAQNGKLLRGGSSWAVVRLEDRSTSRKSVTNILRARVGSSQSSMVVFGTTAVLCRRKEDRSSRSYGMVAVLVLLSSEL
eukprot:scaffold17996_cov194-Amphora_coffeaeformis.AAC.11